MSRRLLASLLTAVMLVGLTAAAASSADETLPAGTVAVTTVVPTLITRDSGPMTLAGSISNPSATAWEGARIEVRADRRIITTRSALDDWISSTDPAPGSPIVRVDVGDVAAGATRIWQATISPSALASMARRDGAMAVEVRVTTRDGRSVAQRRTAVPSLVSPELPTPTPIVLLVPITWVPDRVAAGRFLSDRLLNDVSPGGRLARALEAGSRATRVTPQIRLTYLVDAAVLDAVTDLADGARIGNANQGREITATEQELARQWLDRAAQVLPAHDVVAMPYGTADIDALLRSGNRVTALGAMERGSRHLEEFLQATRVRSAVWLGTSAAASSLPLIARAGVSTVIVPSDAVPATSEPFYTPSGSADLALPSGRSMRATLLEPTLSQRWQQAAATPSQIHDDLALTSDLLVTTLQLPTTPRTQVLSLPLTDPDTSAVTETVAALHDAAPFISTIGLSTALVQPAGSTPRQPLRESTEGQAVLPTRYLSTMDALRERMRVVLTVAKEPELAQAISDDVLAGVDNAFAITLRGAGRDRVALWTGIADIVTGYETGVSVISGRRLALSGDRGVMPLTVRNDLPFTVQVQLRLVPSSPARFIVEQALEPLVVQPGERASLQIPVQVLGTDSVTVTARLVTTDGSGIGVPATIEIRTAAYARVATYVVAGAFLLLLLLIVRNAVRRARTRRERRST